MSDACRRLILDRIRHNGPLTFAGFMELALYDPQTGYYPNAARRSGRGGDFYTSVDVSPLFGEMLADQIVEMARVIGPRRGPSKLGPYGSETRPSPDDAGTRDRRGEACSAPALPFDLVEAGAGNGRLSRDVLDAIETIAPDLYARLRLHLVERSAAAREAQRETLGRHAPKLASSGARLPSAVHGLIFANELLDALPTHVLVGRDNGLREVFIDARGEDLVERELPPSTPSLAQYFERLGIQVPAGWRFEVNLQALDWMRAAAGALDAGFLLLVDYGDDAGALYCAARRHGTLATFTGHVVEAIDGERPKPWLRDPGGSDITAHVDFTSVCRAAEAENLSLMCAVDQMHFLLAMGVEGRVRQGAGGREDVLRRLALKTLVMPGGLGTSHHVLMFGKNVGRPVLKGCGGR